MTSRFGICGVTRFRKSRLLLQKIKKAQLRNAAYGSEGGVGGGLRVDEPAGGVGEVGGGEIVFLLAELQFGATEVGRLRLRLVEGIAVEDALSGGVVEGIAKRRHRGGESGVRLHGLDETGHGLEDIVSESSEKLRSRLVDRDPVAVADLDGVDGVVAVIADAGGHGIVFHERRRVGQGPSEERAPLE